MLKKITEKIRLLPVIPKEDEILCDTCGGIGWMHRDGYIEPCKKCESGVIKVCPRCKTPYKVRYVHRCQNEACMAIEEKEAALKAQNAEKALIESANKYTLTTAPKESTKMYYSESYGYNEGYFSEIEDLKDYCSDRHVDMPNYVWGTCEVPLTMDAYDFVSQRTEDLWEGAMDSISNTDIAELQDYLDKWCQKQTGATTYYQDTKYLIQLNK